MDDRNAAEFGGSVRVTDAIELRLLRMQDADAVYDLTSKNREHLASWISWIDNVVDISDTCRYLSCAEREAVERTSFKAGIWDCDALIGAIDLHEIDWLNRSSRIGYWLDKQHTGRGIMTRVVSVLTDYAFDTLDLHRIEVRVAIQNHASRRIPERLGFSFEGVLREVQLLRGEYLDHAVYALIRA